MAFTFNESGLTPVVFPHSTNVSSKPFGFSILKSIQTLEHQFLWHVSLTIFEKMWIVVLTDPLARNLINTCFKIVIHVNNIRLLKYWKMFWCCGFASDWLVLCFTEGKHCTSLELIFVWFYALPLTFLPRLVGFVVRIQVWITALNSLNAEVGIIYKPVNWSAEQFRSLEHLMS